MSEPFLEEQLRRIRKMSERISEAHNRQHEIAEIIERNRVRRDLGQLDDSKATDRVNTLSAPRPPSRRRR